jgi:Uncharacterised nucleotidyltransferase
VAISSTAASIERSPITDRLADILANRAVSGEALQLFETSAFLHAASYHGVLPLVAESLRDRQDVHADLRQRLQNKATRLVASDLVREAELCTLLEAWRAAGVRNLLIKGAHLAYSIYARSDLRPRLDTDVLVAAASRTDAEAVLLSLGYEAPRHVSGDLVSHQALYVKRQGSAAVHALDLHWKVANPQLFADALSFDELWAARAPLPRLHIAADGLSQTHALALACVHRVAHHYDSPCLIWLYDIHLLAAGMTDEGWGQLVSLAQSRGISRISRQGLVLTAHTFGTSIPDHVLDSLQHATDPEGEDATAAYLHRTRRPVENLVADMRALPSWSKRIRLVREHLFPSPRYMREVYAPSSRAPLPVLYTRRVLRGARKWFAPGAHF